MRYSSNQRRKPRGFASGPHQICGNRHAGMPAPTTLCPGVRHVEEFDPNEEYESGEEVSYVTFDLGNIEPTLVPSSSTYRLIVSELEQPPMRLSHRDTENRGSMLPLPICNCLGLF